MAKLVKFKKGTDEINPIDGQVTFNNGMNIKFPNGLMIWIHTITCPQVNQNNGTHVDVTLPVNFIDNGYRVSVQLANNPSYWSWIHPCVVNKTVNSFRVAFWNNASEGYCPQTQWDIIVVGCWKKFN